MVTGDLMKALEEMHGRDRAWIEWWAQDAQGEFYCQNARMHAKTA